MPPGKVRCGRVENTSNRSAVPLKASAISLPAMPASATPWQEIYRASVGQLDGGAVLEAAVKYRAVAEQTARHNH